MKRKASVLVLAAALFATVAGTIAISTPASAGTTCWQVDCNTCCRGKGGVICTQRACI
jgi:hypothetical protein